MIRRNSRVFLIFSMKRKWGMDNHESNDRNYDLIIFDLDGTLTNPQEGILNSFKYALSSLNEPIPSDRVLRGFIGPSLWETFSEKLGFDTDRTQRAVAIWREYFNEKGIYENMLYVGIKELLCGLSEAGSKIAVATIKPQVFADRVIEHFELNSYVSRVVGSNLNGECSEKKILIAKILNTNEEARDSVVMVGDRAKDIEGAHANGIDSIGVLYGFGGEDELKKAHAGKIVPSVTALKKLLIQG